nr:hypothetical protein [Tanacetum cinerariifolium]
VYVCQPPRFDDPDFPDKVYKVEKALYGLHQAPRAWFLVVKKASTPMETSKPLLEDKDGEEVDVHMYRSMIGSLMYLTSSRPDIMFVLLVIVTAVEVPYINRLIASIKGFHHLHKPITNSISLSIIKTHHYSLKFNIMSTSKFATTHNLIAFLEKPSESDGFEQIVDFLNANQIKYALTVSPTIYTLCIKQFWTTVKIKTVKDDVRLQALIDGKKVVINEASIRHDLKLNDAEVQKLLHGTNMASVIICLANNKKFNFSKYILTSLVKNLEAGVPFYIFPRMKLKELMELCTNLSNKVLDLESEVIDMKSSHKAKIEELESRVEKLEEEESSQQGRKIADIDADAEVNLENVYNLD